MDLHFFKKEKKKAPAIQKHVAEVGDKVIRDWKIMLLTFTALLLAVVFIDGWLLVQIHKGDFFEAEEGAETNQASVNRKTLLDAAGFFEMREKELNAFKTGTSTEIDPSL